MRDGTPPERHNRIVYAHLQNGAVELNATDWLHPTRAPRPGNTVGLYVSGDAEGRFREIFDALAVGSDPALFDELRDEPFGIYGHLADRFGVHWFFRGEPAGAGLKWCRRNDVLLPEGEASPLETGQDHRYQACRAIANSQRVISARLPPSCSGPIASL